MFKKIIEEMMPFHKYLGVKLLHAEAGNVKLLFPYKKEFVGDPRSAKLHGGIIAAAMDASGGAAAMTKLTSEKDKMATVDMRIDYLQPGKSEDLIAEGKIVRGGNSIIVTKMTTYHPSNPDKIIAEGKAIFHFRRKEDDK